MQFIHLDSIDDERVSAYTNLTEIQLRNKLEPSKGLFIAESPKVIDRALTADREPISLLVEEPWIGGMSETFARIDQRWGTDIPVYVASPEQLKQLTGYRLHRGALAAMKRWPLPSVEEVCRGARRIAVMENIVDHTNVGALMRSAAALNVDAVLVTPSCGDPLYRRAARVSMGTVFQIPWTRIGGDDKHYWPFTGLPDDPNSILASMGNYVANTDALFEALALDEKAEDTKHDMGGDIAPYFAARNEAGVYDFNSNEIPGATPTDHAYWRDVGTLKQFYDAHMDLISYVPEFNLYNTEWPIYTLSGNLPPAKFVHAGRDRLGHATDSIVSPGVIVSGGEVHHSVLSPNVRIHSWSQVVDSILFDGVTINRRARVYKAILDKNVVLTENSTVGIDTEHDLARGFTVTPEGITVVPKGTVVDD